MSGHDGLRYLDLGTLSIERKGVSQPVRAPRVSAILGALLMRANQPVSSDALIEAVWSGSPPEGAATTLESHLWRLRQVLEPDHQRGQPFTTVVHDGTGYRLVATVEQVDSLLFEKLTGEARDLLVTDQPGRALARCDEALALWRGEPWTPHSDQLWATASASRMHQLRAQLRRHRVESLLELGNPEVALNDLDPLLDEEPLDESLWSMAMLAAYRLGRVGQALETYTRARRTLIEEAGIEPGQQLRDLQAKILDRDQDLKPPTRATNQPPTQQPEIHLPIRRTELIGRDSETEALVAAVTAHQLVTLVGPAGCGKTRLVIEAARQAAPAFPDGVWFVDLTAANDRGQLLDAITSALGLAPPEVGTVTDALWTFARSRRMLLVLDNCEHLLDDVADLLDQALGQRSELALLTTSREPLDLDGEYLHTLTPLPVPSPRDADEITALAEIPAVRLFLQRLQVAAPQLDTSPSSAEIDSGSANTIRLAAQICQAVDGLPLAIELAAGQARSYTLQEIADRVRTDLASLSRIGRGGDRHHATLRGAIELSTVTLDSDELAIHHAVAVVPGPFTATLAAHLADLPQGRASAAIAGLVHRSLLTPLGPRRPEGSSRFAQLATVRAHALSSTDQGQPAPDLRRNLWVAALAADIPPVGDRAELVWHSRLDDDYAAVRATLQHCLVDQPHHPIGAAVAARLGLYWSYRGMAVEWGRWALLAQESDAAEPYDRLLVTASYSSFAALTEGSDRVRTWLDSLNAYSHPMTTTQRILLAQYLPAICLAAWLTQAPETCRAAADLLRRIADETGHQLLDLFAAVTELLTRSQTGDPDLTTAIEDCYRRADAADNFYARWATAVVGVIAGLTSGSPDLGLRWSDRQLEEDARNGFDANVPALEVRGALQVMAGQPYDGVRTLAQSRASARRTGLRWPSMATTLDLLATAESQLSATDIERAHREGNRAVAHAGGSSSQAAVEPR